MNGDATRQRTMCVYYGQHPKVLPTLLCANHKISISKRDRVHNCGWTSIELVHGFTLVTNYVRNRSHVYVVDT